MAGISVDGLRNAAPGSLRLVDIRKKPDGQQIPGSQHGDGEQMETAATLPFAKDETIVLYCGSGNSCARVAETLRAKGYSGATALEGGYAAWKEAGLPLETRTE